MLSMEEFYSGTRRGDFLFYVVAVVSSLFLAAAGLLRLFPYANIGAVWIATTGIGCIAVIAAVTIGSRGGRFRIPDRLKLTISITVIASVLALTLVL